MSGSAPEASGAFAGFIGAGNLLGLVRNTAPYLFDGSSPHFPASEPKSGIRLDALAAGPRAFVDVLRAGLRLEPNPAPAPAEWTEYFALCVAAHFATVATFVPTDVDTKIRDRLWTLQSDAEELERMAQVVFATTHWDIAPLTARFVSVDGFGHISGHDGERLSLLAGGLMAASERGHASLVDAFASEIARELEREAAAFDRLVRTDGAELDVLVLSALLTHNVGDVDQGLLARGGQRDPGSFGARFARLAHEGSERFGGVFIRAARIYRETLAAEGHRHYPLREIPALRSDPALLLPVGPFFDGWGASLARYPRWNEDERAHVLSGIIQGVRRVKGQVGYSRALAGFDDAYPAGLFSDGFTRRLSSGARKILKDPETKKAVSIRRVSFESSLRKKANSLLAR